MSASLLKINPKSTASVLGRAHAVTSGMTDDPGPVPAPTPSLAVLQDQAVRLDLAQQRCPPRAKGAAAARDVERAKLVSMLESECSYVQTVCDESPEQAVAIASAAGFTVASAPVHDNPVLKVKNGASPGTVHLDANVAKLAGRSGKKTCFNWQWTADGGRTFNDAPSTPHGKTTIAKLPPLTMVGFRVSVTDVRGSARWSPVVSILVQ